jgi:type II secretory pathway component GspD/PulD (secretin)
MLYNRKKLRITALTAVIVLMLLSAPAAASENYEDYVLYTVKAGDTLKTIADLYGANPEEIALYNDISDKKPVTGGTVIKIKKPNGQGLTKKSSQTVSMDIRDADIRDILTSLSVTMKKSIIYTEEPVRLSISVKDVSPMKALELLTFSANMSYIEHDNIILVGKNETINVNFYTMLPITKFDLSYITAEEISKQADKLAIPIRKITMDSTQKRIWAQGSPQALTKMRELVYVLDRAENLDPQEPEAELSLLPKELKHIRAQLVNELIAQLGIPCRTVLVEVNPHTIWIDGDDKALSDIDSLIKSVDIAQNQVTEESEAKIEIEAKKLRNITTNRLIPLINGIDVPVEVISIDSSGYNLWMRGEREDINIMNDLINRLDASYSRDDINFFIFTLTNIRASDAAAKLDFIGIENVNAFLPNYPQFSRELLVSCPSDRINDVKNILKKLDVPGEKIKVIVDYSKSPSGKIRLEKRRDLIIALTGVPKECFTVTDNVTRDAGSQHFVLWVEQTPENVELIREVVESIDNPLSNLN